MANTYNTLYLQKYGKKADGSEASIVNLTDTFGIYTGEGINPFEPIEVKIEGNSQDWADESGLDVYDAKVVNYKAYDIEIPIIITGDTPIICRDRGAALSAYLTGHDDGKYGTGSLFMIWHPWLDMGAAGVRFKSTKDNKFNRDSIGNVFMTRTLVLECTRPDKVAVKTDLGKLEERTSYDDQGNKI